MRVIVLFWRVLNCERVFGLVFTLAGYRSCWHLIILKNTHPPTASTWATFQAVRQTGVNTSRDCNFADTTGFYVQWEQCFYCSNSKYWPSRRRLHSGAGPETAHFPSETIN
jgi:hypothetical protein